MFHVFKYDVSGRNTSPGQQCRESKMRERDDNFLGVCNVSEMSPT